MKKILLTLLIVGCGQKELVVRERPFLQDFSDWEGYEKYTEILETTDNERKIMLVNGIVVKLDNLNTDGIKKLIINGGKVEIASPLRIPGGNVVINAEILSINDRGKIDITPSLAKDGEHGGHAKSIILNIGKLEIESDNPPVFIAHGGNGGIGPAGRNGNPGENVDVQGEDGVVYIAKRSCRENRETPWRLARLMGTESICENINKGCSQMANRRRKCHCRRTSWECWRWRIPYI